MIDTISPAFRMKTTGRNDPFGLYSPRTPNNSPMYMDQLFAPTSASDTSQTPVAAPTLGPVPAPSVPAVTAPAASAPTPAPASPSLDQLRTQFLNDAFTKFGTNYGRSLIGNNFLDGAINDILSKQKGDAMQYLDRGKARGIFNDKGYNAGLGKIGDVESAGRSQLSSLGTGVLDKYRTQANSVRDRAFSSISGLLPGQNFSLDPYLQEGNQIKDEATRNAAGDLRTAFGGTNLFDFGSIGNSAGMAQGAQNLKDADVATALAERKRNATAGRGLGSQGSF